MDNVPITEAVVATVHRREEVTEAPREGAAKEGATAIPRAGRHTVRAEGPSTATPMRETATEAMEARTEGPTAVLRTEVSASLRAGATDILTTGIIPTAGTTGKTGEVTAAMTGAPITGASVHRAEGLRPMEEDRSQGTAGVTATARATSSTELEGRPPEGVDSTETAEVQDARSSRIHTNSMRTTSRAST